MPTRPNQDKWNRFARRALLAALLLVKKLGRADITPDEWGTAFYLMLEKRHTAAAVLGRKRAANGAQRPVDAGNGQTGADTAGTGAEAGSGAQADEITGANARGTDAGDTLYGMAQAETQKAFLDSFVADLLASRYIDAETGELREAAVNARAAMYIRRLLGTANAAFVSTSDPSDLIEWVRTADESCLECIEYADGGPYTPADLPTTPGAGETSCMTNCLCYCLRLRDGVKGFEAYTGEG